MSVRHPALATRVAILSAALPLAAALAALLPTAASAQSVSTQELQKQREAITAKSTAEQAECRKKSGAAQQTCISEAKARERTARAELDARAKPVAKGSDRPGQIRAGQVGHVSPTGRLTVGGKGDIPESSAGAMKTSEQLAKSRLPSNQPVDIRQAAAAAAAGQK